jgi:hypothetical protein
MDTLGNGIITLANGGLELLDKVMSPVTLILVLLALGFAWFTLLEFDEVDRQGTKPEVRQH